MKLELHTHTKYSHGDKIHFDGVEEPESMVKQAAKNGADTIFITDHDSMEGIRKARSAGRKFGIEVVSGEEVSTKHGHMLALGINELIKPGLSAEETVDRIHQQGGVSVAPHAFDILNAGLGKKAILCDAMETYNANNVDRLSNIKAKLFANRHNIPKVAGSDAHTIETLGHGMVKVDASDAEGALKQIMRNNTEIVFKYPSIKIIKNWSVKKLQMSYPQVESYIDNNYSRTTKMPAKKLLALVNRSPGKIDKVIGAFSYIALGGVITYSAWKTILEL
jgi:predicted metal-dependent phosphoesterase TrpH